eukprot:gb/GFBE01014254.1/.p1 GENE.gb/GFBE01014254.1/~~gb/GFBE01014254.1/.p1  ORF type:complete len:245 (+),score=62.15 gb/GFBE01014254.1/:1-735(+)
MGVRSIDRSVSNGQLRGGRQASKDDGSDRDPGIPKFYFLRTGKPTIEKEPLRMPKERAVLPRSRSASGLTGEAATPGAVGRALRGAGGSMLRAPLPAASAPLTLARLAEDLAPPDVMESRGLEEAPPGIIECRARLEAFRNAAVEAISLEAIMSIEEKRNMPAMGSLSSNQAEVPRRLQKVSPKNKQDMPMDGASAASGTGAASEWEASGDLPGVEETKRKLDAFKAEVARAARADAAAQMIRM